MLKKESGYLQNHVGRNFAAFTSVILPQMTAKLYQNENLVAPNVCKITYRTLLAQTHSMAIQGQTRYNNDEILFTIGGSHEKTKNYFNN